MITRKKVDNGSNQRNNLKDHLNIMSIFEMNGEVIYFEEKVLLGEW